MNIVRAILRGNLPPGATALAFGSRAAGRAKPFSDLDVAIDAGRPLTLDETASLRDAFCESDLPWKVDIVDRHTADPSFWRRLSAGAIPLLNAASARDASSTSAA